jgi:hypothetical protein
MAGFRAFQAVRLVPEADIKNMMEFKIAVITPILPDAS